jgi:hypothetical protein
MDLFYRVDTDEMLDKSQFGDIMLQVQNFLYKQHGIKLSNFVCDIDELLEKKFEGMEILNEEFIPRNLSNQEIINIINNQLKSLNHGGNLIIIDQYIFPKDYSQDYVKTLIDILRNNGVFKNLIFVTNKNYNSALFTDFVKETVKNNIVENNSDIKIVTSNEFHDRFWISPNEEGFICGTSLNGIGKKYSSIYELSKEDSKDIIRTLRNKKLIAI